MTRVRNLTIITVLLIGVVATIYGFYQLSLPVSAYYSWEQYSVFLVCMGLITELLARQSGYGRLASAAVIAVIIAIVTGTIWPFIVCIFFALSAFIVGSYILCLFKIDKHKLPLATIFLVGIGAYGTLVSIIAHLPVNYPGLYGLALVIPVFSGWRTVTELAREFSKLRSQSVEFRWFDLVISSIALLHFTVALMPEVGHDALAMHLFVPGHMANRHEWGFDAATYVWAVMPMLADWIYTIVYMLAGESSARIINVGFIFVLCWLIRDMVIWAAGNESGGRWASLLFLLTPLTLTVSSSLFIESIWASFVIAGSLLVFRYVSSNSNEKWLLPIAGILLGYALATKAVTFTILPVLFVLVVYRCKLWLKADVARSVILGVLLIILVGSIPYITAWYLTGNPIFPFFNKIFQSPFWLPVNFEAPQIFAKGISWDVLYQITFHTEKYLESKPGGSGFQWLLLFVPAFMVLVWSTQRRGLLLFAVGALSVVLAFYSTAYLRYVFPAFCWFAAGIGVALSKLQGFPNITRKLFFIISGIVVGLNFMFINSGTYYADLDRKALLSVSGRDAYISKRVPIRKAVSLVNKMNIGKSPVAVFSLPLTAGLSSDVLYANWYNYRFQAEVNSALTIEAFAELLAGRLVDYVILDNNWGQETKRALIEAVTDKIVKFGSVTVRKLKSKYTFQKELLTNPDFSSTEGWSGAIGLNNVVSGKMLVNVETPVFQTVSVSPGHRYKNTVTAMCAEQQAQGRVQVNWLDAKSKFISADINLFDCTSKPVAHSMDVIAPDEASSAVIYATGHTEKALIINKVSFKQ